MNKLWKIVAIVAVFILVGGLAAALGVFVHKTSEYETALDNVYDASYYACCDNLADMENKLAKLTIATSTATQKTLLNDVWADAEVMTVTLAQLAGKNEELVTVMKFVNQLGDFAYYLGAKLPAESLTDEDKNRLDKLYEITRKLKEAFTQAGDTVALGGGLYDNLGEGIKTLSGAYELFNSNTIDYPEMIYDGPFSDGLLSRDTKFLSGKPLLDAAAASDNVREKLGVSLTHSGENAGSIPSYVYTAGNGTAQITKNGGYLVQYANNREVGEKTLSAEQGTAVAAELLAKLGYDGMQAVWVSEIGSTVYINFAFTADDVVYYPDLIKVKVGLDDGTVLGVEAATYIYNHCERAPIGEVKPASEAKLSELLTVTSTRLAVIPTEWNTEEVAYEFAGTYEGNVYYVYCDAYTLEEIKVMRVIKDGNQGTLIA